MGSTGVICCRETKSSIALGRVECRPDIRLDAAFWGQSFPRKSNFCEHGSVCGCDAHLVGTVRGAGGLAGRGKDGASDDGAAGEFVSWVGRSGMGVAQTRAHAGSVQGAR